MGPTSPSLGHVCSSFQHKHQKFSMGYAPRSPHISFLFTFSFLSTFTRPQDFSSFQRKYKKFSRGLCPQTPLYILPVYMKYTHLIYPSINIQQTIRFLLISAQISKNFLVALPYDTLHSPLTFLLTASYITAGQLGVQFTHICLLNRLIMLL